MNLKQTKLHILHEPKNLSKITKTGVSLHCHTENSKEMMDFIPLYAQKLPIISFFWKRESKKYIEREGKEMNFDDAFCLLWLGGSTEHVHDNGRRRPSTTRRRPFQAIVNGRSARAKRTDADQPSLPIEWRLSTEAIRSDRC